MGAYASSSDVADRLPGRVLTNDSTSQPTLDNVDTWILQAEARVNGALAAAQISIGSLSADGRLIIKTIILDIAEGVTRKAMASAGGIDDSTEGQAAIEAFAVIIKDIRANRTDWEATLTGGTASSATRGLRGHALDNQDGKTIADGDFAPVFTRDETF